MKRKKLTIIATICLTILLISVLAVSHIVFASNTIFEDSFECPPNTYPNIFTAWDLVYGTPTITNAHSYQGSYSMLCDTEHEYVRDTLPAPQTNFSERFYYYFDAVPTGNVYFQPILLRTSNFSNIITISSNTANDWFVSYRKGNSFSYATVTQTKTTGVWYEMALDVFIDNSNGFYKLYFNDILVWSITGIDNDNVGGINYAYVGNTYGGSDATLIYIDYYSSATSHIGSSSEPTISGEVTNSTMTEEDWNNYNSWLGSWIQNGSALEYWKNATGHP